MFAACIGLAVALSVVPSHATAKIQQLVTPGRLVVWFVQETTVQLISMEYSFDVGTSQDPADKPGVGHMVANLLDEGSGNMDTETFHERLDRRPIQLFYSLIRDCFRGFLGILKDDRNEAFGLLRTSLSKARFQPKDVERFRAELLSRLRSEALDPKNLPSGKFF